MKNSLTLPSLSNNLFNSLRDEDDEPIYTCTNPFMINFIRNSIKLEDVIFLINIINLKLLMRSLISFQKSSTLAVAYVIF